MRSAPASLEKFAKIIRRLAYMSRPVQIRTLRLLASLTLYLVQPQMEAATPVTEEIGTLQFVIDCTFEVGACHCRYQPPNIACELIKMIVAAAPGQSAAVA